MANQTASPHEAEVARKKLKALGPANPMSAPRRGRPDKIEVSFGSDGVWVRVQHVDVRFETQAEQSARAAAEAAQRRRAFDAAMDELRRKVAEAQDAEFLRGFKVESKEEFEAKRRAAQAERAKRKAENPDWGTARPGVKFPRGGRA